MDCSKRLWATVYIYDLIQHKLILSSGFAQLSYIEVSSLLVKHRAENVVMVETLSWKFFFATKMPFPICLTPGLLMDLMLFAD